jgi:hypothetical protein
VPVLCFSVHLAPATSVMALAMWLVTDYVCLLNQGVF